jgi:hypothetical protein
VKLRYSARRRRFVDGLAARDVYETHTRATTGDATSGTRLNRTLDELRDRFGFESIAWGSALRRHDGD